MQVYVLQMSPVYVLQMSPVHVLQVQSRFYNMPEFSGFSIAYVPLTPVKTVRLLCCKNKECTSVRTFKLDPLKKLNERLEAFYIGFGAHMTVSLVTNNFYTYIFLKIVKS